MLGSSHQISGINCYLCHLWLQPSTSCKKPNQTCGLLLPVCLSCLRVLLTILLLIIKLKYGVISFTHTHRIPLTPGPTLPRLLIARKRMLSDCQTPNTGVPVRGSFFCLHFMLFSDLTSISLLFFLNLAIYTF